jgi:hypothetical protein
MREVMNVIRVRKVADGEELVLAEELWEARLELGQLDPRAEAFERRHQALSESQPRLSRAPLAKKPVSRLRAKTNDWSY